MPMLEHPTEWPGAIKGQLTRKIGPLPVWGWGAVAVGGIIVFRLVKTGKLKMPSSSGTATATNPVGTAVAGGFAGNYGSGSSTVTHSAPAAPATAAAGSVGTNPGGTSDGGSPGGIQILPTTPATDYSNTGAANDAITALLLKLGIATQKNGYIAVDSAALSVAPQSVRDAYTNATGVPTNAQGVNANTGAPNGSMAQFTGVVGTTSAAGMIYNVFRNGVLIGSEPGTGSTDTAALGRKYGVNG